MVKMSILAGLAAVAVASCFAPAVERPAEVKVSPTKRNSPAFDAGRTFFVSATGTPAGDGSENDPWDLQTALNQPSTVHPGDTIWLRGGTYVGTFMSSLTGTAAAPIRVRQYPTERATVDGNAVTTLAAALDVSEKSCSLAAGLYAAGGIAQIDSEQILLFIKTGANTYTIERGWNGTTPAPHSAGATVTTINTALTINGAYTWYMGFEIMNSSGVRTNSATGSLPPEGLGFAIDDFGPGTRIINMVIHDTGQGIGLWTPATDAEVYGNLIYYNGWDAPDRGHGHGVYIQNQAPSIKRMVDNFLFEQFAIGSQAYTENGNIDNVYEEGNTAFRNGILSQTSGYTYNLLIGGKPVAASPSMVSNFTYSPHADGADNNLGYNGGCTNATVTGNYFAGGGALILVNCSTGLTMSGNTLYGSINGFTQFQYSSNAYYSSRPTGVKVFIRPNQYEDGRSNITVYNWDNLASVSVDLSSILSPGDGFEIRNVEDFFGDPVASGRFNGSPVVIPMSGLAAGTPVGVAAPAAISEFHAFVLFTRTEARRPPAQKPNSDRAPLVLPSRPTP